jgi:hypothetical protein
MLTLIHPEWDLVLKPMPVITAICTILPSRLIVPLQLLAFGEFPSCLQTVRTFISVPSVNVACLSYVITNFIVSI